MMVSLAAISCASVALATKDYNSSKSNTSAVAPAPAAKARVQEQAAEQEGRQVRPVVIPAAAVKGGIEQLKEQLLKQRAEERQTAVEEKREAVKVRVEAKKVELETKQEERKAELKARLQAVKDEKKKAAVERLDKKIGEINAKLTNHWLNVLTRFEDLLGKVSSRADKAEAAGRDVSNVRVLVEKAHSAIGEAREALTAQLSKTYPFEITDEAALGAAVSAARTALNNDLKAVRESVQAAHKAVVEVIKALKGVPDVDKVEQEEAPEQEVPEQAPH